LRIREQALGYVFFRRIGFLQISSPLVSQQSPVLPGPRRLKGAAYRRQGYVFNPKPLRADKLDCRLGQQQIEKLITATGRADGVKVAEKVKGDAVKVKYATAHDLRRSFGDRWAARIMPQMLMELMRHESIEVTLRYYVGRMPNRRPACFMKP
jgi:integrase